MLDKPTLRQQCRAQRKSLTAHAVLSTSQKIAERCIALPEFSKARHVGFYVSDENEIDCAMIMNHARTKQKNLYLPIIKDKQLFFHHIESETQLHKNQFGISEPITTEPPIDPQQLDLLFIPLVLFDEQCHRIGRGAGYYDRYLAFTKEKPKTERPILIGLAYEFQKGSAITPESWDIPMDYIMTEQQQYARPNE